MVINPQDIQKLGDIFGKQFSTNQNIRDHHSHGEDIVRFGLPAGVIFAETVDDVVKTVKFCQSQKMIMVAFGAGTSLEGHVAVGANGISLDLSRMQQIITISPENRTARIMAGVTRQQLNRALAQSGLFFSVDPGSHATIGGMAATGASGTNSVRYGTIRDNILSMQVVMASGEVVETATQARKSSAGYNFTQLLIGSEGTLGIITELLVKLHPIVDYICVLSCQFASEEAAIASVIEILQIGIAMARIEFIDATQMAASIAYSALDHFAVQPTLFLEFSGISQAVQEEVACVEAIIIGQGGHNLQRADKTEARNILWQARHNALYAALASVPGSKAVITDSCVPINQLAITLKQARKLIAKSGLQAPIVGHVGEGNFHAQILVPCKNDILDQDALLRARNLSQQISQLAIAHGGSCSGEHGIGCGKIDYLAQQHGDLIPWMRAIKQALDPNYILNPNKIF